MDQRTTPAPSADAPLFAEAALFDRLAEPYLVLDAGLAVVTANPAWHALFGNLRILPGAESDPGADERQHEQLIRTLAGNLRAGESRMSPVFRLDISTGTVDHPLLDHPAAQRRYWQVYASFLAATRDAPSLITLRFDDVTSRILAETADRRDKARIRSNARLQRIRAREAQRWLDDRTAQFDQVLEFAGVGAWEIDVETGKIECSEQCLRDLGVQQPSDITREWLLGGDAATAAANWNVLAAGERVEVELNVLLADGPGWVLIRGMGRFHEDGWMQSVIGFTLDITSRKQRELELGAFADAERSARVRSEALARTMDQFIAAVSHELRAPLNAIVSWAELLKLAADPTHVTRAGEAIRRNGRQLTHMVDDLLDSGAIATGKLSVHLQPVDLGALAASVAEDMRKLAAHKGLELHAVDIVPCVVMADESRIRQVLWNLLTNAVKFTDAGSVDLSVAVVDGQAEIVVRDTGRGIDPAALTLVFERFQQIEPQSSGRVGGLGLGLWLVRHIVGLHGGTIVATSDGPGCGASFTVRLALAAPNP